MIIKLKDVVCYANDNPLGKPVTLTAPQGSLVILDGCNGAGKSTMLRALAGIISNVTGTIELAAQVCYIGHELGLHENLTVAENLHSLLTLEIPVKKFEISNLVKTALSKLQMSAKKNHYPWQLSQGQKHKLNLAKLLFSSHPIWLLDEPFVHLDLLTQNFLRELLQEHLQQEQAVVVITSHTPVKIACQQQITVKIN